MKSNYSELGKYIREVNERNSDLAITNLLGVSMEKTFIQSVANLNGVDMSVYKVLKNEQLACKLMSVGRDEKLPVDLYKEQEPSIVSSAYYVFEPNDKEELLPEYLMMWLCRPENDRYIGFISGGDVRGGISWETFCSLPIKVPSISKQREIVKEYNVIQNRIALNHQLIQKLEETAQAIYKQWFVEIEFPDENGTTIGDLLTPKKGKNITRGEAINGRYPVIAGGLEPSCYHNSFNTKYPVITISASGANAGYVNLFFSNVWAADCSYIDTAIFNEIYFAYVVLKVNQSLLMSKQIGTGQPHIYPEHIVTIVIPNFSNEKMVAFNKIATPIFEKVKQYQKEITILDKLKDLLLSKLATIEN